MAWVIANTSTKNQQLYSFDVTSTSLEKKWELVEIKSTKYDFDGSILLSPETLIELKESKVAVFETKKSAKSEFNNLGISVCRYVELRLDLTKEFQTRNFISSSSWTELNQC